MTDISTFLKIFKQKEPAPPESKPAELGTPSRGLIDG
jgi:hypothetical protein